MSQMRMLIGKSNFPIRVLNNFQVEEIKVRPNGLAHPLSIRLTNTDVPVFEKIFLANEYDLGLPARPEVIIDCGANVGYSVAWFRAKFPAAKIIAIEPDPRNFQRLKMNCGRMKNVVLIQAAIWSSDGTVTLQQTDQSGRELGSWGVRVAEKANDGIEVATISLDSIVKTYDLKTIDILKVDVEGAEKEVFEAKDSAFLPLVSCLVVETHERFKPGSDRAVKAATAAQFTRRTKGENQFFYRNLGADATARPNGLKHIWLLSDARSGSTWLSALINAKHDFSEYFEPLHNTRNPEFAGEAMINYFPPGKLPEKYVQFYRRVFAKRWSLAGCGPTRPQHEAILVKDIHAMLLAKAVVGEMRDVRPVCLIRHPADVALSKLTLEAWRWFQEPALLLNDKDLAADLLAPFRSQVLGAKTQYEKYVVLWAMLYFVVKHQFGDAMFYINYKADAATLKAQLNDVRQSAGAAALSDEEFEAAFAKRSPTDRAQQKRGLTAEELAYADEIIEAFDLRDLLSGVGPSAKAA